jgi:polyphosphate kinase 2
MGKDADAYEEDLIALQTAIVAWRKWSMDSAEKVLVIFEGRDAAGKDGSIRRIVEYLPPRTTPVIALPKPSDREKSQWYFQRYTPHLPAAGDFVLFNRSWYNRGGVEPVMGFCTPQQHERFLDETPHFEERICKEGIRFFKFWLNIGREMQLKRFHDRRHSPLKNWKYSPIDVAGMKLWDEYTKARDTMLKRTHSPHAPWTIVKSNDKRRARIAVMRRLLLSIPYKGRDTTVIGAEDPKIIGDGPGFLGL